MNDIANKPEGAKPFNSFLAILEDGRFHEDISVALRDLNAELNNHAAENGGKAKGELTIKLKFALDRGVFTINSKFDTKTPEEKRQLTVAWSTPGNNFSPDNPRQHSLFEKPRDVGLGREEVRDIV